MAEKIKLSISPAVAAYIRPGTDLDVRLSGCAAAENMAVSDRVLLLFCLSKDSEPTVRASAISCLEDLPVSVISGYLASSAPHPHVVAALQTLCRDYHDEPIANNETPIVAEEPDSENATDHSAQSDIPGEEGDILEEEEEEEYLSKYKTAQLMGIGEKIKMALSGDKEWRAILVKDANKLVSGSVIKNPRITDAEVLALVKSGIQNDEIMRLICANKEWVKNYTIRKALIENNRTPVQNAIRYLGTMGEKDLAQLAKSKNISTVISTMAKRLLLNKKK